MDRILENLQGKAFHLSSDIYSFISNQYAELIAAAIPDLNMPGFNPGTIRQIIEYHRAQFVTEEYIFSRIQNPTTGTIDHLHAEITAHIAVTLGQESNYSGYAIELLRVAAHYHDSDRSFPEEMIQGEQEVRHDMRAYREYKEKHAANSARIGRIMSNKAAEGGYKYPSGFCKDLIYLILNHELGGEKQDGINLLRPSGVEDSINLNDLADILTDADSISYFMANILTNWEECGKDKKLLGNKVHFMYDRMTLRGRDAIRRSILESENHILGKKSDDEDITNIREVLLHICI